MGTGSRSLRSVPVPISPVLTRGVGKRGQNETVLHGRQPVLDLRDHLGHHPDTSAPNLQSVMDLVGPGSWRPPLRID
jgi:hypothetical protein